jgi:hypothetical protein
MVQFRGQRASIAIQDVADQIKIFFPVSYQQDAQNAGTGLCRSRQGETPWLTPFLSEICDPAFSFWQATSSIERRIITNLDTNSIWDSRNQRIPDIEEMLVDKSFHWRPYNRLKEFRAGQ